MTHAKADNLSVTSLTRSSLFRSADEKSRAAMAGGMVERNWTQGQLLFAAGDISDGFYIVLEGAIRLGLTTPDGGELTLRDAEPGDIFGEIGALDSGPRSASARVTSANARTAFLSSARLRDFLERHPALLMEIAGKLCTRLRETTEQLEGIALYPLRQRLARFILAQGQSRGRDREVGKRGVSIAMSQSALATLLGASRPKLNGALLELERAGLIARSGAMFIYDPLKLAQEAEGSGHATN